MDSLERKPSQSMATRAQRANFQHIPDAVAKRHAGAAASHHCRVAVRIERHGGEWSPRAHLASSNNEGTRPYSSIRTQSHTFTAIRTTKAQTSSQRCVTLKARPLAIRPWTLGLEPIAPQPNDRTRSTTSLICSHRPGAIRVEAHDSRRRPLQEFFVVFGNHRLRAMRQPTTKHFAEQLFARIGALRFQTSTIETTM